MWVDRGVALLRCSAPMRVEPYIVRHKTQILGAECGGRRVVSGLYLPAVLGRPEPHCRQPSLGPLFPICCHCLWVRFASEPFVLATRASHVVSISLSPRFRRPLPCEVVAPSPAMTLDKSPNSHRGNCAPRLWLYQLVRAFDAGSELGSCRRCFRVHRV